VAPGLSTSPSPRTEGRGELTEFARDAADLDRFEADARDFLQEFVLSVPALGIAGGTDEVVRNTLGERVLGLPKDPGPDSRTPFRDLIRS
jgi:hypothetical protein